MLSLARKHLTSLWMRLLKNTYEVYKCKLALSDLLVKLLEIVLKPFGFNSLKVMINYYLRELFRTEWLKLYY